LLQAYSTFQALRGELQTLVEDETQDIAYFQSLLNSIDEDNTFTILEEEASAVLELFLSDFQDSEGWNEVHNSDGIRTSYRHEYGNPIHSLKMEGIINQPIFNVCSVIYEIDLYTTWVPRLAEARTIQSSSGFHKIAYCRTQALWPVAARDTCMYGYGVDLIKDESSVVVMVRSCKDTDEHDHPPAPHGVVRVDTKRAGFLLKPLSPTSTYVQVITNTDPKMALIPYWLLNMVTTRLCHLFFVMLRNQAAACAQIGSAYYERINTNPIYLELKQQLEEQGVDVQNNEEVVYETQDVTEEYLQQNEVYLQESI